MPTQLVGIPGTDTYNNLALAPVGLLLAYTVALHALIIAQFRYLLPVVPWLLCLAAYGAVRAWSGLRQTDHGPAHVDPAGLKSAGAVGRSARKTAGAAR